MNGGTILLRSKKGRLTFAINVLIDFFCVDLTYDRGSGTYFRRESKNTFIYEKS